MPFPVRDNHPTIESWADAVSAYIGEIERSAKQFSDWFTPDDSFVPVLSSLWQKPAGASFFTPTLYRNLALGLVFLSGHIEKITNPPNLFEKIFNVPIGFRGVGMHVNWTNIPVNAAISQVYMRDFDTGFPTIDGDFIWWDQTVNLTGNTGINAIWPIRDMKAAFNRV